MFVIESEKDIGLTLEQSVNRSYPFLQMEEGDSFQICSDDEELRRVEEAVRLAEQACRMADPLVANHLMILAVAYAQAGQSGQAINTTERAIRLAETEGDAQLAQLLRVRLQLYRSQDPSGPDVQ